MKKGIITPRAYQNFKKGHPWLRADDVVDRKVLPSRPSVFYFAQHWWFCSPDSYLRLRRFGPNSDGWMKNPRVERITNADQFGVYFGEWLAKHFAETLAHKIDAMKFSPSEDICLRWIFSENDLVPGLIVDIFGDQLVAQLLTAPIENFWLVLRKILIDTFTAHFGRAPQLVELRNARVRTREGLEIIEPEMAETRHLSWNGLRWNFTPASSQKTGAYLDQRENHLRARDLALKYNCKTAWDLCCYQGGFSLHLLSAGLEVVAVDQSSSALEILEKNVALNGFAKIRTEKADVFEWLTQQLAKKNGADLIILDPPSFVKSRDGVAAATKGYLELNILAFRSLNPGGVLVSCVCSHHISLNAYKEILTKAAKAAERKFEIIECREAGPDHKPIEGFDEGRYLQAWYLRVTT